MKIVKIFVLITLPLICYYIGHLNGRLETKLFNLHTISMIMEDYDDVSQNKATSDAQARTIELLSDKIKWDYINRFFAKTSGFLGVAG